MNDPDIMHVYVFEQNYTFCELKKLNPSSKVLITTFLMRNYAIEKYFVGKQEQWSDSG